MAKVYGMQFSPFTRKVILALEAKGVDFSIEQVSPAHKPDGFETLSPLGKIPAFQNDEVTLADSTVICEYIEERYSDVSLLPNSAALKAKSRWLEEYSDTVLVTVTGPIFFEMVVKGLLGLGEPDQERIQKVLTEAMPKVYSYLDSQVGHSGYLVGDALSMADISIGALMVSVYSIGYTVDATRWPKYAAYVEGLLASPLFQNRIASDKALMAKMKG